MNPKVSVIMPVYNASSFLRASLNSILEQTFTDFELLIINDASVDDSLQIIQSYSDERIRVINNHFNEGVISSLNKGLALAKGEYVARMDADDICMSGRFAKQVSYLNDHPEVAVLSTKLVLINEKGEEIGYWQEDVLADSAEKIKSMLPEINCIGHPTIMMRSKIVSPFGYNPDLKFSEDWGLWLVLLAENYTIDKLNEVLLKYRVHDQSVTVKENKKGVLGKIFRFKLFYLIKRIKKGKFKNSDFRVLSSTIRHLIRYLYVFFQKIFRKIKNVLLSPKAYVLAFFRKFPVAAIKEFLHLYKYLFFRRRFSQIFFFPYYHTGGAERVHSAIIEAAADKSPVVFITDRSSNNSWLNEFKKNAEVLEIYYSLKFPYTRKWFEKKMVRIAKKNTDLVVFSCNSKFFYELIPFLPAHVKCIDLIHAFVHHDEDGPEKWSLPVVSKLSNRVVINKKTIADFKMLYKENNVDLTFLHRIICINNFIEPAPLIPKTIDQILEVLYVGRGGDEKRIHLISMAARLASEEQLPVTFHFAGDVKHKIPKEDMKFCILHGVVTDPDIISKLYEKAHLLIIASSREGFPIVIMEAMMAGVIPASTRVGGIDEHIKHLENGILIDEKEPEKIVKKIVELARYFISNKKQFELISANAHQYALKHFRKIDFFNSYQSLFNVNR
jgi:glycosyltransferase involved in cell wall biosynthesis